VGKARFNASSSLSSLTPKEISGLQAHCLSKLAQDWWIEADPWRNRESHLCKPYYCRLWCAKRTTYEREELQYQTQKGDWRCCVDCYRALLEQCQQGSWPLHNGPGIRLVQHLGVSLRRQAGKRAAESIHGQRQGQQQGVPSFKAHRLWHFSYQPSQSQKIHDAGEIKSAS